MKRCALVLWVLTVSAAALQADKPIDSSSLPPAVQRALNEQKGDGEVRKVKSVRVDGRVAYEVDYREQGEEKKLVLAEDGTVLSGDPGGRGKGKAKGKAKGHYKQTNPSQSEASSQQTPAAAEPPTTTSSRSATSPPVRGASQPNGALPAPPPQATTPATHESASSAAVKPTAAQVKVELNKRIGRINTLDNSTRVARAGLSVIAKETGVSMATLQTQRQAHEVGTAALLIANEMSKATGKPAHLLLKQRLQAKDWDRIAAENRFDMAALLPKLDRVQAAMEMAKAQQGQEIAGGARK